MAKPVPYSQTLTSLARRVQKTQRHAVNMPTLLAANKSGSLAVLAGTEDPCLHVFDSESGKVVNDLPLPQKAARGADFRSLTFNNEGSYLCGYNPQTRIFAVWSLKESKLINEIDGEGVLPAAITFLHGDKVAVADSPRICIHRIGGDQTSVSYVAEELVSIRLFAPEKDTTVLLGIGVFAKKLGGHLISSFHIRHGSIVAGREGPNRPYPKDKNLKSMVRLQECARMPGLKSEMLVYLEEEEVTRYDPSGMYILNREFKTRLFALDPISCKFVSETKVFDGRYCLEEAEGELHLLDELGRKRRLVGFPLQTQNIDWRLEE